MRMQFAIVASALLLAACEGSDHIDAPDNQSVTYVSDVVEGHFHRVVIPMDVFTFSREGGYTVATTPAADHVHDVALTGEDLATLRGSLPVTRSTTVTNAHSHLFEFTWRLPAGPADDVNAPEEPIVETDGTQ